MTASLLGALAAGILTVAAPCVLPLLPVIVGGSIVRGGDARRARWRPYVIAGSLAVSVVAFTLALKATTALLGIPPQVWQVISGAIVILLGLDLLFPAIWDRISTRLNLQARTNTALDHSVQRQSFSGDILTGAALGPVFSSCSPTYALIVAAVLPVSFAEGVTYVVAYALGLAGMLLLIALLGRRVVQRLGWMAKPDGWFRRTIGAVFILVGIAVITGFDKQLQTWILDAGLYDPIAQFEEWIGAG
ncbi:cytochrome c biogenesis protein CcdA [Microbacterium sp. ET2]|uniref:cytochrome c biogenesis CcdA family protein n=1 Tax=Microbacterium albipurpureum TaxID=3050384 RepID=UPI00259C9218|nr:cytochrome c biogenesis protein CcdA [Microbacterium sp. ET2 (Ac-2212)]WJL96609.1 cytochrome c biogenesis protein CcdA [Microbacterium sp. ET2 (Ac-2212)]